MSRTMNVNAFEGWRKTEDKLLEKIRELNARKNDEMARLQITVESASNSYEITLEDICKRFGLTLKDGDDAAKRISLYQWLPGAISSSWKNLDTGSDSDFSDVEETDVRNLNQPIESDQDLAEALQESPLWARMSQTMRNKFQ